MNPGKKFKPGIQEALEDRNEENKNDKQQKENVFSCFFSWIP